MHPGYNSHTHTHADNEYTLFFFFFIRHFKTENGPSAFDIRAFSKILALLKPWSYRLARTLQGFAGAAVVAEKRIFSPPEKNGRAGYPTPRLRRIWKDRVLRCKVASPRFTCTRFYIAGEPKRNMKSVPKWSHTRNTSRNKGREDHAAAITSGAKII